MASSRVAARFVIQGEDLGGSHWIWLSRVIAVMEVIFGGMADISGLQCLTSIIICLVIFLYWVYISGFGVRVMTRCLNQKYNCWAQLTPN